MSYIRVYSAPNLASAELIKAALENEGLQVEIRGEQLTSLAGAIPVDQSWLQLWVPSEQGQSANDILAQQEARQDEAERVCPSCGELSPGHFSDCWSCGGPMEKGIEAPREQSQTMAAASGSAPSGAPLAVLGAGPLRSSSKKGALGRSPADKADTK